MGNSSFDPGVMFAQIGSDGVGAAFQYIINKENREWANEQYEKQRQHALEDRDYANNYNHPKQQKQRLKEAGLNPFLMYEGMGKDSSVMVRGADSNYKGEAYKPNSAAAASAYQMGEMIGSQKELANAQQIAVLTQAQKTLAETDMTTLDTQFKRDAYQTNLKIIEETLRKIGVDIDYTETQQEEAWSRIQINEKQMDQIEANIKLLDQEFNFRKVNNKIELAKNKEQLNEVKQDVLNKILKNAEQKYRNENVLPQEKAHMQAVIEKLNAEVQSTYSKTWNPNQPVTKEDQEQMLNDLVKILAGAFAANKIKP